MTLGKLAVAAAAALMMALGLTSASAQDQGLENPRSTAFHSGLEGKKVVFLPLSMGFDLTEGRVARMRAQAKRLNYSFEIRDPAWSTDAGTRAAPVAHLREAGPDRAHNPDIQSYARLLSQAQAAGIKVVQINLESNTQTDSYVGADWTEIEQQAALAIVDKCGAGKPGIASCIAATTRTRASAGIALSIQLFDRISPRTRSGTSR